MASGWVLTWVRHQNKHRVFGGIGALVRVFSRAWIWLWSVSLGVAEDYGLQMVSFNVLLYGVVRRNFGILAGVYATQRGMEELYWLECS
jgi:hypothetical protein